MFISRFSYIILSGFLFVFKTAQSQVTIANGLPGCLPIANKVGVSCGGGSTMFDINASNQFVVNNVDGEFCCSGPNGGGDGASYFEFATLNISGYSNVNISMSYSASNTGYEDNSGGDPIFGCQGTVNPDNSHDQIVFMYSLDGASFVQSLYVHGSTQSDFTGTWMAGPLNGSSLVIRIYAANKSQAEAFYFSNLLVTATTTLSAGPDQSGCAGTPINLMGDGAGTWSGGSGTFANTSDPETTYTPAASEEGISVTLTFTASPAFAGCPAPSDQMVVSVLDGPTAVITPDPQSCGSRIATASGGVTYAWSGGQTPNQSVNTFTQTGNYTVTVTNANGCTATASQQIVVNISPVVNITGNPIGCNSVTLTASGGGAGGSYSWSGGSNPSAATNTFTASGVYVVTVTDGNGCTATGSATVTVNQGPVGMLSGSGVLCPGQCTTFTFTFTSGSEPYTVNLTANPPGFNLPPVPGITASSTFTVCYQGGGFIPTWNQNTLTLTIPTIFSGSGGLTLTGISDGTGCPGMASGSFNLTLTNAPSIQNAGPLTECAGPNGEAIFDLTSLNGTVTGGNSNLTVTWFEDAAGMNPISNPANFESGSTTVYVSVSNGACSSPINEVDLIVEEGDIPFISMLCSESGTDECTICAENGSIELDFNFGDGDSYIVTVREVNSNETYEGTVSNTTPLSVPAMATSVFELLDIQPVNGCPSFEDYDDMVEVMVVQKPIIDPISIPPSCDVVILPPITGTNLTGNEAYYTEPGGNGSSYLPGEPISGSITLYIYDASAPGCEDEEIVIIDILPPVIFDPINDLEGCGQVTLPAITGFGVSPNAVYNTAPDGSGIAYEPSTTIDFDVTLYLFDPDANPDCVVNEIEVQIIIYDFPEEPDFEIDCQSGNGAGTVTFSSSQDPNILYSLDGGPFQSTTVFTNVTNGPHIVQFKDNLSGCEQSLSFTVNCDCPDPAEIIIPVFDGDICEGTVFTLENIQFDGSATSVSLSHNGQGILTPSSSNISPFSLTYTPGNDDTGKDVRITMVTNDPDGLGPCEPLTKNITIKIRKNPSVGITGIDTICTGGSITLQASGAISYVWSDNGGTDKEATFSNIVRKDTLYVTGTDAFGCLDTATHLINIKSFTAGSDSIASFCKSSPVTLDLFQYLRLASSQSGKWYSQGVEIPNPRNYTATDLPIGNNTLIYVLSDSICGMDTAKTVFNIRNFNNAGTSYIATVCDDTQFFNFTTRLGNFDAGGSWIQRDATQLNLANPSAVNISSLSSGSYSFLYIIPGNGCSPDTAFVSLNLEPLVNAGMDASATLCEGAVIDLISLIQTTDKSGTFLNPNGISGLSGSIWNTNGLNSGNYEFFYTLAGSTVCKPDTAILKISLDTELNPGKNISDTYCPGDVIDLNSLIDVDADKGGVFYRGTQVVNLGKFTTSSGLGTLLFRYVVGDGLNCPVKESTITLTETKAPDLDLLGVSSVCEGKCTELTINKSQTGIAHIWLSSSIQSTSDKYFWENDLTGTTQKILICAGSTGPFSFENLPSGRSITIRIDSVSFDGCTFSGTKSFNLMTGNTVARSLNPTICRDEVFQVGPDTYSAVKSSGITKLPSLSSTGCDTLVTVNVSFYPESIGTFAQDFCNPNATVVVGNKTFSKSNPSGIVVLEGASVNGCDSTVNVLLTYSSVISSGLFEITTCDTTYEFVTGNKTFNINNPEGEVLFTGLSSIGCDSLLKVKITYTSIPNVILSKSMGSNGEIQINVSATPNIINNLLWSPSEGLSCIDCPDPVASPEVTTNYVLNYQYGNGCVDTARITIEVIPSDIVIPNIFSPDGDGNNDFFFVKLPGSTGGIIKSMRIYDRWGNKVFNAENVSPNVPDQGWGGDMSGRSIQPGVFVYTIEIQLDTESAPRVFFGNITLAR